MDWEIFNTAFWGCLGLWVATLLTGSLFAAARRFLKG